jgi:threonine aldolase
MFGGAMRQAGILAAGAMYALEHHRERLAEDHANAKRLAEGVGAIPGISIAMPVETNMVFFDLDRGLGTAAALCDRLRERGVLMLSTAPQRVRAVCHLDVDAPMIDRAVEAIGALVGSPALVR